jgi:DNA polymerase III epsilon subunit-like protein
MSLFAVFDVETTGRFPEHGDRIVEFAAVVLDEHFRVVRLFDSLVNPERTIPAAATTIHKISQKDISGAPTFTELLPELHACFQSVTHLVGHNVSFDLRCLKHALGKSGEQLPEDLQKICTKQLAESYQIGSDDHQFKLEMVATALQLPVIGEAHQAAIDAGVAARIFSMLYEKPPAGSWGSVYWPFSANEVTTSRQRPRNEHALTLQRLAGLGLCVRTNRRDVASDDTVNSATVYSGDEESDLNSSCGLSAEAVAEMKATVRIPEAEGLPIRRPHPDLTSLPVIQTWYSFTVKKKDISTIAVERKIKESTVYEHLQKAVEYDLVEISRLATPAMIERISAARACLPGNETKLKPLFESLNAEISYGLLKCVTAWLDRQL